MRLLSTLYISYAHQDIELVKKLEGDLSENDIKVIYDKNIITDGGDWQKALDKGISEADCVLVLISENGVKSQYVMNELGMAYANARERSKLLLPVLYGNVTPPQLIRGIQYISWKDDNYQEVINRIVRAVNNRDSEEFTESIPYTESAATIEQTPLPNKASPTKQVKKRPDNKKQTAPKEVKSESENYWIFRMNPDTWYLDKMKVSDRTSFSTYYSNKNLFGKKRPEYEILQGIKVGDQVMAFATGKYQAVACIMGVTDLIGYDEAQGQSFKMVVKELLKPEIPLDNIKDIIPDIVPKFALDETPPELFFRLSADQYKRILEAKNKPVETVGKEYEPSYLTEGNHQTTTDQLGFQNDINSFASVIALRKVNPPLAIGLFGNWGSGKSFFMEKLSQRIDDIVASKEAEYIGNVVQVKFNSWHYSDANLWASMTTQIFESLYNYVTNTTFGPDAVTAMYKELNMSSVQIEETAKKIKANEIQVDAIKAQKDIVEATIGQKKKRLELWEAKDLAKIVFSNDFIQNDFKGIKADFNTIELEDNIEKIEERIGEVETIWGQIHESYLLLKETANGKWIWVWILAALFGIIGLVAIYYFKEHIQYTIQGALISSAFALGFITKTINALKPHFKTITNFYNRLKSLKNTIDSEKEKVRLNEHDEVDKLNNDILNLTLQRALLVAEQTQTENKKQILETQINDIGSGKLLANFLAERNADDTYTKQLGIISWIRKDFSKLDDFFGKQKKAQEKEKEKQKENESQEPQVPQVQIDRIVLYIDDLDRCNEEVVVKVLEAIHLLLAFPLFVVIVGVDPRWLNNALSEKYKTLFGNKPQKENPIELPNSPDEDNHNSVFEGVATSYDYLEKIFQIPFALKPINKTGREKLIQYLVKDEMEVVKVDTSADKPPTSESVPEKETNLAPTNGGGKEGTSPVITPPSTTDVIIKKAKEKLFFSTLEMNYMQQISALFGQTPRTINRYVNIYRIIKTHGNLKVSGDFSEDDFKPIMLLLGIVVGCSALAEDFLTELSNADDHESFSDFINDKIDEKLKTKLNPLTTDVQSLPIGDFKKNVELISRFSFRTLLK